MNALGKWKTFPNAHKTCLDWKSFSYAIISPTMIEGLWETKKKFIQHITLESSIFYFYHLKVTSFSSLVNFYSSQWELKHKFKWNWCFPHFPNQISSLLSSLLSFSCRVMLKMNQYDMCGCVKFSHNFH